MALGISDDDDVSPVSRTDEAVAGPSRRRVAARRTLAVLPTLCTLGNCLCGFLVVFFASRDPIGAEMPWNWTPLTIGAVFVFLGMLFDGLDGRLARMTRRTSELGEQLDSMADMVTFGVAPAFLAVQLVAVQNPFIGKVDTLFDRTALIIACIYVACAALRLARFNIEIHSDVPTAHMSFEGLPTPGAAGTVASLVLLHQHFLANQNANPWAMTISSIGMVAIMFLVALAMVSRLRYVHVTNRYLRERARIEYIAILVAVGLLLLVHLQGALAAGLVAYALSAPVGWVWGRTWRHRRHVRN